MTLRPIEVQERHVAGVRVRFYRDPLSPRRRVTVFAHGGGFTWGSLDDYDQLCRNVLAAIGGLLISVDYRLAPEHPFPAALDDVLTVWRWASEGRSELNMPDATMIIAGDSAGGCLAASLAQKLLATGGKQPNGQLLIYPMIEHYRKTPSQFHDLARDHLPNYNDIRGAWDAYIGTGSAIPTFSVPGEARSLAGLPPTIIITAANDPLRFEAELYARRLVDAGVSVRQHRYPGVGHSFLSFPADQPGIKEATSDIARWVANEMTATAP